MPTPTPDATRFNRTTNRRPATRTGRAVAKSLSWQALGLCTTMLTAFLLTGSLAMGSALALSSAAIGTVMFVLHERAWDRVRWGRAE